MERTCKNEINEVPGAQTIMALATERLGREAAGGGRRAEKTAQ
ncbi:MAG: hypothetical protein V8T24_07895 [Roseburia hominis]